MQVSGDYRFLILHLVLLEPCTMEKAENISAISYPRTLKPQCILRVNSAFMGVINEGKTVANNPNEFGISQALVKKRLKMAGVSTE